MIIRLVLLFILIVLRFYHLGIRPPHHDESVNGWFVDGIFQRGYYQYDPQNYHGPLYFYFLTLFESIFGRSIEVLRTVPLLFGAGITLTPFLFKRWLTERGAWIAAFAFAVSPAMVFYSRYSIHETAFVFACILFMYYWLRARTDFSTSVGMSTQNAVGLGITLGAMACLKENFVIYLACIGCAEGVLFVLNKISPLPVPKKPKNAVPESVNQKMIWIGLVTIFLISISFIFLTYSALGRDVNGIPNFFKAFMFWSETGSKGNGHQKPMFYWVNIMTTLEWFAFLGLLLSPLALKKVKAEIRLLSILAFGLFAAYSIVNYKTPWCLLSFYWGFVFIAAFWISTWMENKSLKPTLYAALLVGFSVSVYQTIDVAYVNVDQDGHYYIYGQTFRDFMGPVQEILDKVEAKPELKNTLRVQIISQFTWPLPWLFGQIKQVGYYGEANTPPTLDADYLFIDKILDEKMAPRIKGSYSRSEVRSRQWASPEVIYRKQTAP